MRSPIYWCVAKQNSVCKIMFAARHTLYKSVLAKCFIETQSNASLTFAQVLKRTILAILHILGLSKWNILIEQLRNLIIEQCFKLI